MQDPAAVASYTNVQNTRRALRAANRNWEMLDKLHDLCALVVAVKGCTAAWTEGGFKASPE